MQEKKLTFEEKIESSEPLCTALMDPEVQAYLKRSNEESCAAGSVDESGREGWWRGSGTQTPTRGCLLRSWSCTISTQKGATRFTMFCEGDKSINQLKRSDSNQED